MRHVFRNRNRKINLIESDMIIQYLQFTLRKFRNQKLFSFVDLTGLTIGIIALVIALLTVSWQSLRAATRNPVDALRYE